MDLETVTKNKKKILETIEPYIPNNLKIISGNALRKNDYFKCEKYLKKSKSIAIINEGLLRYLTFAEKK